MSSVVRRGGTKLRRGHRGNWVTTALASLLLLVVGTVLGRYLHLGPLSEAVGFSPVALNLYVVDISIGVATNVLGLIAALAGLIVLRAV